MKAAFIAMCITLVASVALCLLTMYIHNDAISVMDELCAQAVDSLKAEDTDRTEDLIDALEKEFSERRHLLEMLASHSDLHDTMTCITDAKVALECGDKDDAYQALVRLNGMLEHMHDHEKFSLENLL